MASFRWKIAQYFEKRWWEKYLGNKDPDEYNNWKRNYWLGFLKDISEWVKPVHGQSFLDMGCGPAGIFMVLPEKVTAVDPLLDDYKAQLPYFKPERFEKVNFCTSRAEDFECHEPYDIVFSLNVINHVTVIRQAVRTLYKCCKTGGKLVLSADAHNHGFLRTVFRYLHFDILHPYQLTLDDYQKLLESEGFVIQGNKCLRRRFIFDYVVIVAVKA